MTEEIKITIPKDLIEKIRGRIKETNFKSLSDYILFILEQIVSNENEDNEKIVYTKKEEKEIRGNPTWDAGDNEKQTYSKEDEESLKKNLKDLGYL